MNDNNVKTITLNVAYVESGGNTDDGKYFYSCVPNIINITEPDTEINVILGEDSRDNFDIKEVFCTDAFDQISVPVLVNGNHFISMTPANKKLALTCFLIQVQDKNKKRAGTIINCDPQATNVPQ